ncbi:MAG: tetratricopeptide repeat protein, partial [Planctomycetes bacterium]|nr:tetratricopeptide repeat protein [Planctomycetota bacterium]
MPEDLDKLVMAYRADPGNENLFNSLKQHYFFQRDWESLAQLHLTRAKSSPDPRVAAPLFYEASKILGDRLNDPEGRLQALERSNKADPRFEPAMTELGLALAARGRCDEAVPLLRSALRSTRPDRSSKELHLRLADCLVAKRLGGEAVEVLREILKAEPLDPQALERIEKALAAEGRWEDLAQVLERRLKEDRSVRERDILFRLASIYRDRLGKLALAAERFERIVAEKPNLSILGELEKIYATLKHPEDLARVLAKIVDLAGPAESRAASFRLGRVLRDDLGRTADAARATERALGKDSVDPSALADLEDAYREGGLWDDLVEVLRRKAAAFPDPSLQAAALLEAGRVTRDQSHDPGQALPLLQQAFALAPREPGALGEIETTYRLLDQPDRFAAWLEEQARRTSPGPEAHELLARAGEAWAAAKDLRKAADLLLEVRRAGGDVAGGDERIGNLLRETGRLDDLTRMLDEKARAAPDPADRVAPLLEKARLLAGLPGREGDAEAAFREALAVRPEDSDLLGELAVLLDRQGKTEALLDLLGRAVEIAGDLEEVAGLHAQAGRLLLDRLRDPSRALERFRAALLAKAGHVEAARGLLEAARAAGDRGARGDALRLLADAEPEAADRLRALTDLASLREEEGDPADAARILEDAVARDPGSREALEKLDALYASLGRPRERASALVRLAASLTGAPADEAVLEALDALYRALDRPADRLRVLESLARARRGADAAAVLLTAARLADERGGADQALALLAAARAADPDCVEAYDRAAAVLRAAGRSAELADVLRAGFPRAQGPRKAALARELASVLRDSLGDRAGAIAWLGEVRALAPSDAPSLDALAGLLAEAERHEEAARAFEQRAELEPPGEARAAFLVRAAEVLERPLGRTREALDRYAAASALAPGLLPAVRGLRRCAEALKDWDAVAAALEREAAGGDPEALPALARLHEERRLDPAAALAAALRWRAAAPADPGPWRRIASLQARLGRREEACAALEALAGAETDPAARAAAWHRLAQERILAQDPPGAERALRKAVEAAPGDAGPLSALERFHASRGSHAERVRVLEALLALDPAGPG